MDIKKTETKVQISSSIWPLDLFHIQKRVKKTDDNENHISIVTKKIINDEFLNNSLPKYHYNGSFKALPIGPLTQVLLPENFIDFESISK